ncbi:hypothetical protein PHYSODRAFT_533827, partial [Phytophthora sojae]
VLRQQPCADALEHLGPISQASWGPLATSHCTFGSTKLLDWIWDSSCTSTATRSPSWSLYNYLRSDPDYYRWEFAMATEVTAKRGDVAMMKWLLTHFQDCEVPIETVEQAVRKGHVAILQLLLNGASDEGEPSQNAAGGHVVLWKNRDRHWRPSIMKDAIQSGNVPELSDEETVGCAVRAAMQSSSLELVEFFLPEGKTVLDFVSLAGHSVEVVEKLLDDGYFERFEVIDALALPNLAEAGRLDLLQRASKYYKRSNKHWQECWRDALFVACRLGHCTVVRWMIEHPMWRGVRNLMKRKRTFSRLLWYAADHGSVEVMQSLHDLKAADSYGDALVKAVAKNDMKCINWLLANFPQSEHVSDYAVLDEAARRGNLDEGCTIEAIEKAFTHAHLGVAIWLAATYPNFAPEELSCYSDENEFDVTLFVHAHYPDLIGTQEYCYNRKTSNNYRWGWLEKHYPALDA